MPRLASSTVSEGIRIAAEWSRPDLVQSSSDAHTRRLHAPALPRRGDWLLALSAVVVVLTTSACTKQAPAAAPDTTNTALTFSAQLSRLDSVPLRSPPDSSVIRMSAVAASANGDLAIADYSEANVKRYSRLGALRGVLGGRGVLAGEYQQPVSLAFDAAGHLHIFDANRLNVTVVEPSGRVLRIVPLAPLVRLLSGLRMTNGDYAVVGGVASREEVLFVFDSLGRPKTAHLRLLTARPAGTYNARTWSSARNFSLAERHDSIFVVCSLLDSLWTVVPASGSVAAEKIRLEGYQAPSLPQGSLAELRNVRAWWSSIWLARAVETTDNGVMVAYSKGTYYDGSQSRLAMRSAPGSWTTLTSAPIVADARGDTVITVTLGEDRSLTVLRYLVPSTFRGRALPQTAVMTPREPSADISRPRR